MTGYITEINYDKLIEKSLKHVVVEALKIAERQGLPGENHFYITFKTTHPQVSMSEGLKNQYPNEMTIVIQHQYSNLVVANNYFSIDLSFNGIPQTLTIPYEAITYFGDPYAKFGSASTVPMSRKKRPAAFLPKKKTPKNRKKPPAALLLLFH